MLNKNDWDKIDADAKIDRMAAAIQDLERRLNNVTDSNPLFTGEVSNDVSSLEKRIKALEDAANEPKVISGGDF